LGLEKWGVFFIGTMENIVLNYQRNCQRIDCRKRGTGWFQRSVLIQAHLQVAADPLAPLRHSSVIYLLVEFLEATQQTKPSVISTRVPTDQERSDNPLSVQLSAEGKRSVTRTKRTTRQGCTSFFRGGKNQPNQALERYSRVPKDFSFALEDEF